MKNTMQNYKLFSREKNIVQKICEIFQYFNKKEVLL